MLRGALSRVVCVVAHELAGQHTQQSFRVLRCLFDVFVNSFREKERLERERQAREAELYKYKAKPDEAVPAEELERQEEERAFRKQFPDFSAAFADITNLGQEGELGTESMMPVEDDEADQSRSAEIEQDAADANVLLV